ncbi:hypothetical protein KR084_004489 [Drosophila pseudotakahashii]|nr:hypothetical protein KR084_004489 [Drosophila pseudotakahashii]
MFSTLSAAGINNMNIWIVLALICITFVLSMQNELQYRVTKNGDFLNLESADPKGKELSKVLKTLMRHRRYVEVPQMSFQGLDYDNLLNITLYTTTEEPTTVPNQNGTTNVAANVKSGQRRHKKLRRKTKAQKPY